MKKKLHTDKYTKKAIFSTLHKFDPLAKEHDYIEITEWKNGEGFDVEISTYDHKRFQLTWGEYEVMKKLVKLLNKT